MQHVLGMCAGQCFGDGQADRAGSLWRHPLPLTGQGPSGQQLHDDQAQTVGLDIVVDPDDMRMIHSSEDLRFGFETTRRALLRRVQHFDRHIAVQVAVPALQHQPERASAEPDAQLVGG